MGKATFNIWYAGQKDGILLMVAVRLEHELVPVVRFQATLEQVVKSGSVVGAIAVEQGSFQEGYSPMSSSPCHRP